MWWTKEKEIALLKERLKSAEDRVRQLQRYQEIHHTNALVMQRELANAHAALRRKGKALKILHQRMQAAKEGKG